MRASVVAIAGTCVLAAVVVAVHHRRGAESDATARSGRTGGQAFANRGERQSGWSVRASESGSADPASAAGPAARRGAPGTSRGSGGGRGDGSDWTGGSGGSAAVVTGSAPATGRIAGARSAGGQGIRVDAAAPVAAVPFEGARQPGNVTGDPNSTRVAQQLHGDGTGDNSKLPPPEQGGPVLSIPFSQSSQPERGDGAVFEQGVTFESGKGAMFSTDSQFVIPNGGNIKGDAGSVSFWVQPQWEGGAEGDASLVQLRNSNQWEDRLQVFKNGRYLRFLMTDNTGIESNIGATIDGWQPGEWHQVTAAWGDGTQSFYVDGRMIGQVALQGQLDVQPGTPLYIGSDVPKGGPSANGALSQFQVYNRALTPDEVAAMAANSPQ